MFNANRMLKGIIPVLALIILSSSFVMMGDGVYICVSKTAGKYHYNRQCRGLKQCTHTIESVSLQEAKDRGYSLCGFED